MTGDATGDAAALPATLPAAIRVAASRWPDRIAWRFDPGGQLTFADVDRLTAGYAAVLRERGVQVGDRVALLIRNEVAFPLTWLALSRLGAAAVPVNIRYQTADAAARSWTLPDFADPDLGGTANIQFTSGTTGRPKGCVLPHRYWALLAGSMVTEFPHLGEDDVMHPAIRLAAVAAVPDEIRGEEIKAFYVTTDGAAVEPGELAVYCSERLAAFKVPRYRQPASDLPRTASERVVKQGLATLPGPVFDTATGTWDG